MSSSLLYPTRLPPLIDEQLTKIGVKSPEDVVVVSAVRTALTRSSGGGFKNILGDELLSCVLQATITRTGLEPSLVQDITVGNVTGKGGFATPARMAALHAGFPESTTISTVNRQCGSGLQACIQIASAIQTGLIDIGIGAGVESMSSDDYQPQLSHRLCQESQAAEDCGTPLRLVSDMMVQNYGVTQEEQDEYTQRSHQRAATAQEAGYFADEIVCLAGVDQDDGIGTTSSHTSSRSDGAAAVLMMKRKMAHALGLTVLGKYVTSASVGVPARVMGIGSVTAIPVAVERAGLKLEDVDLFEINEAFASLAIYTIRELGLDVDTVNPRGGALALGHPLGCTGARQIATLLPELQRQRKNIGVTAMCIGSGMGAAAVWERE